jgi:hypothetical protein
MLDVFVREFFASGALHQSNIGRRYGWPLGLPAALEARLRSARDFCRRFQIPRMCRSRSWGSGLLLARENMVELGYRIRTFDTNWHVQAATGSWHDVNGGELGFESIIAVRMEALPQKNSCPIYL